MNRLNLFILCLVLIFFLATGTIGYAIPLIESRENTTQLNINGTSGSFTSKNNNYTPEFLSSATTPCDSGLALDSASAIDAAKAIDLCKFTTGTGTDWGVFVAEYRHADGGAQTASDSNFDLGHGILTGYGSNVVVQNGERMLALSSGTARQPTDPGYVAPVNGLSKGYGSGFPYGWPQAITTCMGDCIVTDEVRDDIALKLDIRVPPNAVSFSFDFKYYTADFPDYACTVFNDWFIAKLTSVLPGTADGNIAIGPTGKPIRANEGLLQVCDTAPTSPAACYTCPLGSTELSGTGYEGHAASSWLTASAPVKPGEEIQLHLAIWDSGDGAFDSTVLIDNFRWEFRTLLPIIIK